MKKTKNASAARLTTIRPHVAGLDVGSREHWVCAPSPDGRETSVQVFQTVTSDLERLVEWLVEQGVESVAMESTSVYWIPIYELLESRGIEAVLVNARQLSHVPGRKTDMHDCQWLQLLHSCGLLRGSFRPHESICQIRALRRQLANLEAERTKVVHWLQKSLDQMNVQIHHAVADVTGMTGMAILRAIAGGERDPNVLASFRDRRCKKSVNEIAKHLHGNFRDEHVFNLKMSLKHYDQLEEMIASYHARIKEILASLEIERELTLAPHSNAIKERLMTRRNEQELRHQLWKICGIDLTSIEGISAQTALVLLTEVGLDLTSFPSEKHFVSWLRLAPKVSISGGKPLPAKNKGLGATRVANALRMSAVALRKTQSALGAAYRRIAAKKGAAVAVFATARKLATIVFRALRYGQQHIDVGAQLYEARFLKRKLDNLHQTAKQFGFVLAPVGEVSG